MRCPLMVSMLVWCTCASLAAQDAPPGSDVERDRQAQTDEPGRGATDPEERRDLPQLDRRPRIPTPLIDDLDVPRDPRRRGGPMLGITIQPLSDQLITHLGVEQGFYVLSVVEDSRAEKAGLRRGDVILRAAGEPVTEPSQLNDLVNLHGGGTLPLVVLREGREREVNVDLTAADEERDEQPAETSVEPSVSRLLDELVEDKLREMASEIESEIGRAQMDRLRELSRRIIEQTEPRPPTERSPRQAPEPGAESIEALREDLRRLRQEVEEIRKMLEDLQQPADA